jgi:ribose transport system substrate-binding protein
MRTSRSKFRIAGNGSSRLCLRLFFGFSLIVMGCSRSNVDKTVTAIPQLASQEIFLSERTGLEETAARLGDKIDWNGPSDSDPQRQVDLLTAATNSNQYGIVINPIGTNASTSPIQRALSKGIPVVVARDSVNLSPQGHLSFLLEDYTAGASLVTNRLNEVTGGRGEVIILGLDPYSTNSRSRFDAVEHALQRDCPQITVADRVISPYSSGFVQIVAEQALQSHPDLVAFIALNNRAGLGAAMAVKSKGATHQIRVIVFDQSLPLLLRLRRGEVDSVVVQNMRAIGRTAIRNINADRAGQSYEHTVIFKPQLVTSKNIDLEVTQEALTVNWESR